MHNEDSFGKRLARFVGLAVIVFLVTMTIIATQKLNTEAYAFIIGGIFVTITIAIPFGLMAALAVLWLRLRPQQPPPPQQMTIPPVILTLPPQYGGNGNSPQYSGNYPLDISANSNRQWVIGEEK